jgi:small GTP-binding protein
MTESNIPLVAFIGYPNSGKSTLLNRLTGTRKAVVADEAHTTRDLNYGEDFWEGFYMRFVDTGGLVPDPSDVIQKQVQLKSWSAIHEADVLVWVLDRKQNPDTISENMVKRLWKTGKPFIIAINKVDDPNQENNQTDYAFMGASGFVNISCNTGYNLDVLMDTINEQLKKLGFEPKFEKDVDLYEAPKAKRSRLKTVSRTKRGSYIVTRGDDGMFESNSVEKYQQTESDELEKPQIEAIIYDLGGVVFDFRHKTMNKILDKDFGIVAGKDFDSDEVWKSADKNAEGLEKTKFWQDLVKKLNLENQTTPEKLQAIYFDIDKVNHEVIDNIIYQKSLGKKVYFLSNISIFSLEGLKKNKVFELFDGGLPRGELALSTKKPHPEAFKLALSEFGLIPETTLYIDDLEENLYGATKAGMKTLLYQAGVDLDQEILKMENPEKAKLPKIMFIGRPNVGKSSMFNAMVGKDIQIVTDVAGTTLSVNDTLVERVVKQRVEIPTNPDFWGQQNTQKHLIFDFDGVLGDTLESLLQAHVVYENVSYEQATENMIKYFSKTQHAKKDKIDEAAVITQKDKWHEAYKPIALEFGELFDGFIEAVLNLKNVRKAIVTSSTNEIVLPLLGDLAEEFEFILDYHDHLSKETKIEQICGEWGISEKEAYYFTDTISDVLELDQYMDPAKVLGCSWGFLGKEKLQTVLPDSQILDNFTDIYKHFPDNYKGSQKNKIFRIKRRKRYILLDSVGIRRPGQRTFGAEDFATYRTIQTAHEADVLCLVLDGSDTVTHQDQVVGGILQQSAKGVVIVVNKADLIDEDKKKKFARHFSNKFGFLKINNLIWVSAVKAREEIERKNRKYWVFDFDGVLGDTFELVMQALSQAKKITRTEAIELEKLGSQKPYIQNFDPNNAKKEKEELQKYFREVYKNNPIPLFNEVISILENLKDAHMAIITSGEKSLVRKALKQTKVNFEHILDYKDSLSKSEKMQMLADKWEIPLEEMVYFTDSLGDVKELKRLPVTVYGCGWGFYGAGVFGDKLEENKILTEPKELLELLDSGVTSTSLSQIWDTVDRSISERQLEITRDKLRKLFNYIMKKKPPKKLRNKKKSVIYDLLFVKSAPPTFHLLIKDPETVHWSFVRFLENAIRKNFGFENTEIRVKLEKVDQNKVLTS